MNTPDKGDRKGIEDEIKRLTDDLNKLSASSISETDKGKYIELKQLLEATAQLRTISNTDIISLESLKQTQVFKDNISYELTSISSIQKEKVENIFNTLKSEVELKWQNAINELILETKKSEEKTSGEIKKITDDEIFVKVSKAYNDSTQLAEYEGKIKIQKEKLFEITTLSEEIVKLKIQKDDLMGRIKNAHLSFLSEINHILPQLSVEVDDLKINSKAKFKEDLYKNILSSALNQRHSDTQTFMLGVNGILNNSSIETDIFLIFDKLINNELTLKGGYTNQTLASNLLSENFYKLSYDLEYEGDDFEKMSDGKKAFVVLKLLLDFSDKNCPILIDQPEDDLDNRAIYNDLVQYLKRKKKLRQIIVATHNPNIVVGADSELVIVANQNGLNNINKENKKFQYVSGSLEHTFKNNAILEVLECKGVREHVCEILEGGDIAFKLREKKYSIKM